MSDDQDEVTPPPSASAPVAPTPNAAGGFNWGLRPGAAQSAPVAPAVAADSGEPVAEKPALPPTPSFVPASVPAPPPLIAAVAPAPAPDSAPAPESQPDSGEPTRPLSWDEFAATQATSAAPAPAAQTPAPPTVVPPAATTPIWPTSSAGLDQPTEAYTVQPTEALAMPPWQMAPDAQPTRITTEASSDPTSAIDSLFAEHQFQPYQEVGVLDAAKSSTPLTDSPAVVDDRPPREPLSTPQKVLMGVAGGLIAVLVLLGMFFLGQHLGTARAATPTKTSTKASTSVPTSAATGGPAAPGVQQWSALQGGECIQPFSSPWTQTFTVVSCTADHNGEMVFKGMLPDSAQTAYPTTSQFESEITPLCSAPTAINYAAASAVTDLQISFSYPGSEKQWIAGDRTYYCFVDRQSGGNLTGDLAVAKATN